MHSNSKTKRTIRKTSAQVPIQFSDGNFSNNLYGEKFEIGIAENCITLSIDLAKNFHVRNKESNCYYDVCELEENKDILLSVDIHERQIIEHLINAEREYPAASWKLQLIFESMNQIIYEAVPDINVNRVSFKIEHGK